MGFCKLPNGVERGSGQSWRWSRENSSDESLFDQSCPPVSLHLSMGFNCIDTFHPSFRLSNLVPEHVGLLFCKLVL